MPPFILKTAVGTLKTQYKIPNTLANKVKETDSTNAEQLNLSPNRRLKFQRYEHIFNELLSFNWRFLGL